MKGQGSGSLQVFRRVLVRHQQKKKKGDCARI